MNAQDANAGKSLFLLLLRVAQKGLCLALPDALGELPQHQRKRPCKPNVRATPEKKIFSYQGALVCSEGCSGKRLSDFTICILAYMD